MNPHISEIDLQKELRELLSHMLVAELKNELSLYKLSTGGFNKEELLDRLIHFALTGAELPPKQIPLVSKACRGTHYPLAQETLMLHGAYKNDYATRDFFRALIGPHFHFTAQGIDWLRERWLASSPPTYAEFAHEWQAKFERTQLCKRAPKQEWAYIRFVQEYIHEHPDAAKEAIHKAWKIWRLKAIKTARETLQNCAPQKTKE